jgi:AcrR family transcriptional regulator
MLDAAEGLFLRHGYGGVTVEDVTDAVGVKKPDLYNHFRDKRELYVAVRMRALHRAGTALRVALDSDAPFDVRLTHAIAALLRAPAFLAAFRQRDAETFLAAPERDALFARAYGLLYQPLAQLLREGGLTEADVPFLFDTLIALAVHFGPLTPEAEIPQMARRISALAHHGALMDAG